MSNYHAFHRMEAAAQEMMRSSDTGTRQRGEELYNRAQTLLLDIPVVKEQRLKPAAIAWMIVLAVAGTMLVWAGSNWKVALGLFMLAWASNISRERIDCLVEDMRAVLTRS